MEQALDLLKYPIGAFSHEGEVTEAQREAWIADLERLPAAAADAVRGLTDEQLDTPYRDGGWTVRQVTHHIADSHMNSFIRFKLALTEEQPTIKPYEESLWAELGDSRSFPIESSLALLESLHVRWTALLRSMSDADFAKTFYHPGSRQVVRLDEALGNYSWHGRHHVAHITSLRERQGW